MLSKCIILLAVLSSIGTMMPQTVDGLAGSKNRYRPSTRPVDNHRDRNMIRNKPRDNNNKNGNNKSSMLARAFRIMYDQGGTTAVLNGCRETLLDYDGHVLVEAAIQAGNTDDGKKRFRSRGVSSGILNALLGCCCCSSVSETHQKDSSSRANMAIELMKAYDDIGQREHRQNPFEPDLVSLCLAYVATSGISASNINAGRLDDTNETTSIANEFLRRAEQFYHKGPPDTKSEDESDSKVGIPTPDWTKFEEQYGIKVLEDAEEFIVLSKPSGMVCYHGGAAGNQERKSSQEKEKTKNSQRRRTQGGIRNDSSKSLEECLLAYGVPLSTLNQEGRGLVHRIDRGTSGCLVVAKTNRMHAFLLSQFFLRRSKKFYSALVCSTKEQLAKNKEGTISVPIEGRPANSKFVFITSVGKHLSRIQVETQQGRRHQVRIHCSEGLNAPILLDPLYGGQSIISTLLRHKKDTTDEKGDGHTLLKEARNGQKFCLHASSLTIEAVGIDVHAPLPDWWQKLEAALGEQC